MSTSLWMVGNSVVVELQGVKNSVTAAFDNGATVSCTLKDLSGADVAGHAWPQSMAYVASSDGVYRATLPPAVAVKANKQYRVHISATGSGGDIGNWEEEARAAVRR